MAPQGIEEGGIERLTLPDGSHRYFLIGGQGGGGGCYQMWAFSSAELMGPYAPTPRRFRLSGGLGGWGTCYSFGALGAWVLPGWQKWHWHWVTLLASYAAGSLAPCWPRPPPPGRLPPRSHSNR